MRLASTLFVLGVATLPMDKILRLEARPVPTGFVGEVSPVGRGRLTLIERRVEGRDFFAVLGAG